MQILGKLRSGSTLVAAGLLMALPLVVAADFGGVLWWTQYVAALVTISILAFAFAAVSDRNATSSPRQFRLIGPLIAWVVFALIQTVELPPSLVSLASPASFDAYTQWLTPFLSSSAMPSEFPVSIAKQSSLHSIAVLALLISLAWSTVMIFRTRAHVAVFLSVIAIGGAAHAAFGILCTALPGTEIWGYETGSGAFGTFINRNNAALLMNLGVTASLGLLAWRLTALTGQEVDDPSFEVNDFVSLVSDRDSIIGVIGGVICLAGILICGSRGGVVSAVAGCLFATGWVRQRRGLTTIPVIAASLAICVALLTIPLKLNLESLRSLNVFSAADQTTLLRDGRLPHWRDGWETAVNHLPAGSGMGTYAYAYLPFQEKGSRSWFHHADNLWLELVVEQGVIGILLVAWIAFLIVRTLVRLSESPDPIDQGLRVAGWYALGAIAVSQVFDFGLIIPCNLFLVTILFSVIIARESQVANASNAPSTGIQFHSRRGAGIAVALACLAWVTLAFSTQRLWADATKESTLRTAATEIDAIRGNADQLDNWIDQLESTTNQQAWPDGSDLLCEFMHLRQRLDEVTAAEPATAEEATQQYQATDLLERRLPWRRQLLDSGETGQPSASDLAYLPIVETANASMLSLPLGPQSRKWQVYLDFAHRDVARSDAALEQLQQFYRNNPQMLLRLAVFAGDGGNERKAIELFRAAVELHPPTVAQVLKTATRFPNIATVELLTDDPVVWRIALSEELAKEQQSTSLLRQSLAKLDCVSCQSKEELAQCEFLTGEAALLLGDHETAFEHFFEAIDNRPTDADLRFKIVSRLKEAGRQKEALHHAREGRRITPDDPRFERIIQWMAEDELRALEN